jgi:hypothetical protein
VRRFSITSAEILLPVLTLVIITDSKFSMSDKPLKKDVRVSSEIARGESLPSLTKTKGFRALLLFAEAQGDVKRGDIYEVSHQALRDALKCNDDEHLRSEFEALSLIKVNWSRVSPDGGGYSIPVSSCTWSKSGVLRYAFDPQFVEAWQNNKLGFRRINWEILVSFRSLYSAKIYEYVCLSHEEGKTITTKKLLTKELRELLGIPTTAYQGGNAGRLYQEIKKAVDQVNDAQDGIRVAYCRDGRGATARHWFEVEDAPKQERMKLSSPAHVVMAGDTRRAKIESALAALPDDKRLEVEQAMAREGYPQIPSEELHLKIYAGRLRNYGVEFQPTE